VKERKGKMTKFYKATFSNGKVLLRSSTSRTYSHAYLTGRSSGFARSSVHAHKAMTQWRSYAAEGGEVVPAVEITGPEHRALRKAGAQ
jgi:hypothetical protein